MDTSTTITTPARRLVRENNTRVPEVTTGYDRDGRHVDAWSTGMTHTGHPPEDIVVILAGTRSQHPDRRMTHRRAQDLLDAAAHAASHPQDHYAADDYLAELELARRAEIEGDR